MSGKCWYCQVAFHTNTPLSPLFITVEIFLFLLSNKFSHFVVVVLSGQGCPKFTKHILPTFYLLIYLFGRYWKHLASVRDSYVWDKIYCWRWRTKSVKWQMGKWELIQTLLKILVNIQKLKLDTFDFGQHLIKSVQQIC